MRKQREQTFKFFILIFVLLAFVYWKWWTPGPRVANDFPIVTIASLQEQFDLPRIWSAKGAEGLGEYTVFTLWSWPMNVSSAMLANLGVGFEIQERLLFLIPIILIGSLTVWNLLSRYKLSTNSKFVSTLFYLANTYVILLIDGGQLSIALAYVWFPASFAAIEKSVEEGLDKKIFAGLSIWVLGLLDIRFVFVLLILCILRFFFEFVFFERSKIITRTFSWLKSGVVIFVIFVLLNAYWLIPLSRVPISSQTFASLTEASNLDFAKLKHALLLLSPHWHKNVFGRVTPLLPEFILIPVLAFLAPVLRKKKSVVFWFLVALVGIFLVKGSNPPLSGIYPWLFTHIPGFFLFRDPTKFFFLVALSYSVLIGITVDELSKRINIGLNNYHATLRGSSRIKRFVWFLVNNSGIVLASFLATYLIFLARPVWLGRMTGTFSEPIYQKEYEDINKILQNDNNFSRVFWIPTKAPLGYSSPTHPSVEASRLVSKRPFAAGVVGTYEIFNFLREAPYMGELFDTAGIGYIAYPFPDTRREELKQDNIDYYFTFSDQLRSLDWVDDTMIYHSPVISLRTKESQDHFFLTRNSFFVVGSDAIYNELVGVEGFKLRDNAIIFAEERAGVGNTCKGRPCTVLLYEKNMLDFAATFIDENSFIFPAEQLDFSPSTNSGSSSWWKRESADLVWWRNFLQEKYAIDNLDFDYGGGWSVAEGDLKLQITNYKLQKGGVLLARLMASSRGGRVEFYQGESKIGEVDTKVKQPEKVQIKLAGFKDIPERFLEYEKADFSWFEVGELKSSEALIIKTQGDINVVNLLVSLPIDEWARIDELISEYKVVDWNNLKDNEKEELFKARDRGTVSYTRISPTHYKIKVENLQKPATLAFSETYDPLWQLKGRSSYPLYSLINGFYVEKDGEYDLFFTPQKYVYPGLFVSGTTLIILIFLLFKKRT